MIFLRKKTNKYKPKFKMKRKKNIFLVLLMLSFGISFAQVGIGTLTPDPSSVLDVTSTTKGILLPRMTVAQRNAIANPGVGLLVYNSEDLEFNTHDTNWKGLSTGYKSVSLALATTTASTTDVLVDGMTITPKAGTYLISFSGQFNNVGVTPATALVTFSVYANGVLVPDSVRKLTSLVTAAAVELQTVVTVTSGQTIEIKWNIDSGATLSLGARTLTLTKVK
jgi:hypothetical protein